MTATANINVFRRSVLMLAGLVILIHSASLYAVQTSTSEIQIDTELTEESQEDTEHVYAYDAVVPAIQYVHPFGWIYLGEVVVDNAPDFQDTTPEGICHHGYLETLFPRIISPNAP